MLTENDIVERLKALDEITLMEILNLDGPTLVDILGDRLWDLLPDHVIDDLAELGEEEHDHDED